MIKLTPEPTPHGPGDDGPEEINYDGDQIALDPIPPRISPQPKIKYFYNKVTKYINGSKIEFNTTEGNEYINIQHGNDKTRITFFEDGNLEIIQTDGDRHDEVNGKFTTEVSGNHEIKAVRRYSEQYRYTNFSKDFSLIDSESSVILRAPKVIIQADSIELDAANTFIRGDLHIEQKTFFYGPTIRFLELPDNPLFGHEFDIQKIQDEEDEFVTLERGQQAWL